MITKVLKSIKPVYFIFLILLLSLSIYLSFNAHCKIYSITLHHDGLGYYMYLPHVFIYHDFILEPGEDISGYNVAQGTNQIFDKYTYGVSVMILPFFLISHFLAYLTGNSLSGFSMFYVIGVMMAAAFYLVLGMFFLIKILSKYFRPAVVMLTLLAIYGGSNLYFYTIRDPAYSHVYSFFLFCLFIYLVPGFINSPTWKRSFLISMIFGLIFLIRPTNGVVLFYLILYEVYSKKDIIFKLRWLKQNMIKLLLLPVCCIVWMIPQLLYWHLVTNKWIVYSYIDEGFTFWDKPKIFHVLFSVQNGMFVYAPIAFFSFIGLCIAFYKNKFSASAIILILALSTYLFASWWCWWYGGAYGHRGYIEFFAFLSIPTAYLISLLYLQNPFIKFTGISLILMCILYSMLLNYAYAWPWEGPNWTWNSLLNALLIAFRK